MSFLFWFPLSVWSQDDARLRDRFTRHVTGVHQEKILVRTDREYYVTGETIWLSAWCVDALSHQPVGLSRVLNLELIDHAGRPVVQQRIRMEDGRARGQFLLVPQLQSGQYLLRAYTNWMKNFDPGYAFHQPLGIINPSVASSENTPPPASDSLSLSFHPEGGQLVDGLTSNVALRILDGRGKGIPISGLVFDEDDREVARFTTSSFGLGSFAMEAKASKSYVARILRDSVLLEFPLPPVVPRGVVLQAEYKEDEDLTITLSSLNVTGPGYLVVHTRGELILLRSIVLGNDQQLELSSKDIPAGITHLSVVDHRYQLMAERLIYRTPKQEKTISMTLTPENLATREKVRLNLSFEGTGLGEDGAQLAVSVYRDHDLPTSTQSLSQQLLISSDLSGDGPLQPQRWPLGGDLEQLDLELMTHSWKRFDWSIIGADSTGSFNYPAEVNGPLLSGHLETTDTQIRRLLIDFVGTNSVMNSADIGPDGKFHFEIPHHVQKDRVYFFNPYTPVSTEALTITSPFMEDSLTWNSESFSPELRTYLERLNANIQIAQVYREYSQINGSAPGDLKTRTHFYGTPDHQYHLDEYTRFKTIKDLFIEYIRWAVIKDNNTRNDGIYVANEEQLLPERALTTIDGIPILDVSTIMSLDPLKIEKIELIDDYFFIGSTRFSGIINFSTYEGDYAQEGLPATMVERPYYPLQAERRFYAHDYEATEASSFGRIPDFRNTLYWNPEVNLESGTAVDLEFFTGDDTGTYRVEVSGITRSGTPVSLSATIDVAGQP